MSLKTSKYDSFVRHSVKVLKNNQNSDDFRLRYLNFIILEFSVYVRTIFVLYSSLEQNRISWI